MNPATTKPRPTGLRYDSYRFSCVPILERLRETEDDAAAELLGISFATYRQWKYGRYRNLTCWQADKYACRMGLHPASIWGQDWWASA